MFLTYPKESIMSGSTVSTEKVLETVGGFGWYQLRLCFMLGYTTLFVSMVLMVMTFSTAEPPWKCTLNSTSCTLNGTFKLGDENFDLRCKLQRSDWEFAVEGDFDSIVTEWDLVCDNAVYVSIVNSTTFLLFIIGSMLSSLVSDKFGRKTVVYPFGLFACLCGFLSAFAQTYWVFALFRALAGIGIGGFTICSFVLVIEYTGEPYRSRVGFSIWYAWVLALALLALLGYLIPSWRTLSIATSVPGVVSVIFWWFSPESLRWLIVKGRTNEAIKVLQDVARVNKKVPPDDDVVFEKSGITENQKLGNIKDLFATKKIGLRTLISWYCW
ncbi:solute carrier family 22 member 1 [Exaiptasia diaphana]|uniref:Major facilitator superfamily (MFS) profile domain-containing protein n=1 Tax=Exaiptasia diaphana TaxID=2652724 RepID=A0A913X094_EXADI|nr:solute carrier family 22 member 1 [Exaiptasia diaphana]